jgi:hypothetical protein
MAKTPPKAPFSTIRRPTDAQLFQATKPVPFKKCVCGRSIISSAKYCAECSRLYELGMKTTPVGQFVQAHDVDTQPKQSHTAFDRSGYNDKIPTTKFPASKKERV